MRLALFLLAAGVVSAQIAVSVRNAASYADAVAPGSLIQLDLAVSGGPLPLIDPSSVSVTLQLAGAVAPTALRVLSVQPFSLIAFLPSSAPVGQVAVVLHYNGTTSLPANVNIVASSFGLFMTDGSQSGLAAAQNVTPLGVASPNRLTHPALPGQYVTLWGTGLGSATQDQVSVLLGGIPAPVVYAGPSPALTGVDQINFLVPDDSRIPNGCYVAVSVNVAGASSNTGSIPKARTDGPCQSPFGLTANQLAQLDSGAQLGLVQFSIGSDVSQGGARPGVAATGFTREETANAEVLLVSSPALARLAQPLLADQVLFSCNATGSSLLSGSLFELLDNIDLGPKLTWQNGSSSLDLLAPSSGPHFIYGVILPQPMPAATPDALSAPFFGAGIWQVSGPGSSSVPAFQSQIALPPQILASNFATLTSIDRTHDRTIAWDPTGYTDDDVVTAVLSSPPAFMQTGAGAIACSARASSGRVTFPAALLAELQVAQPITTFPPVLVQSTFRLTVTPRADRPVVFSIPVASGDPLTAVITFDFTEAWGVQIQ